MQLIDDFKTKYPKYWSVWCHVAAALLTALGLLDQFGMLLPLFQDKLPPGVFVGLSILCTLADASAQDLGKPKSRTVNSPYNPVNKKVTLHGNGGFV